MIPSLKAKKTSQEKRHCRSLTSAWRTGGEKKKLRTSQWYFKHSSPLTLLHQFLAEHGKTMEDLHSTLVQHFQNEAFLDAQEALFRRSRPNIQHIPQEDWPLCGETDEVKVENLFSTAPPAPNAEVNEAEDQYEEVEIEDPYPPIEETVVDHGEVEPEPSEGARSGTSWQELTAASTLPRASCRPPRIPRPREPMVPPVNVHDPILNRDLTDLISMAANRSTTEWRQVLGETLPSDIPYTLFGTNAYIRHDQPEAPASASSAQPPTRITNLWADPDIPVPESEADFGDPRPPADRLHPLFDLRPILSPDVAFDTIRHMRHPGFFSPKDGDQGGYRWAPGLTKTSKGYQVRQRITHDRHWCKRPVAPSVIELDHFTVPRFSASAEMIDAASLDPYDLRHGFPMGSLFRMSLAKPPRDTERYWHGSNLYLAYSMGINGMRNYAPDNGPIGVYCFSDVRMAKVVNYCHYVLSGTGCAWTAFAELAIPFHKTAKFSSDQRVAQQQDVTLVALWFHGVSQTQFTVEHIWPPWDPSLEVDHTL